MENKGEEGSTRERMDSRESNTGSVSRWMKQSEWFPFNAGMMVTVGLREHA